MDFSHAVAIPRKSRDALVRLSRARDLLREHATREISIEEAAKEAALSPYHFIRRFKAVFGDTPHQVLIAARLDKARELLIVSELSVTEVCMAVGFASLGSFSSAFLQRIGSSPTSYRRRLRPLVQVPGVLPPAIIPGCYSLLRGWLENAQFSRSAECAMPACSANSSPGAEIP